MLGPVVLFVTCHRPRLETDVLDELIFDLKEALPSLLLTLGTAMPPHTHTSTLPWTRFLIMTQSPFCLALSSY